jgi:hypothetical protein
MYIYCVIIVNNNKPYTMAGLEPRISCSLGGCDYMHTCICICIQVLGKVFMHSIEWKNTCRVCVQIEVLKFLESTLMITSKPTLGWL